MRKQIKGCTVEHSLSGMCVCDGARERDGGREGERENECERERGRRGEGERLLFGRQAEK